MTSRRFAALNKAMDLLAHFTSCTTTDLSPLILYAILLVIPFGLKIFFHISSFLVANIVVFFFVVFLYTGLAAHCSPAGLNFDSDTITFLYNHLITVVAAFFIIAMGDMLLSHVFPDL